MSMSDDHLIQMSNVTVGYAAKPVLTGVTWTVQRGQAWYVVGRNGAGKSTLLATALGRLSPTSGVVHRHSHLNAASIPQQCHLITDLPVTLHEFVGLGLIMPSSPLRRQLVDTALATCGLTGLANRQVWQVSGGERRRAMIARALALRPEILVLDEPAAGLDAESERDLLGLLQRLRADGVTVIYVTHDLHLAATQATHVAAITNGRLTVIAPGEVSIERALALPESACPR